MPKVVVEKGIDKGKTFSITQGNIVIGRDTTVQIPLSDTMISRLHLKIESRPEGYYLFDLASSNGTFVNGQRVREKLLKSGDVIQIGETVLSFVDDETEIIKDKLIGKTIAGYRIMERIGRGGMGTVYKALQLSLNRVVALKVLAPAMTRDRTFINQFIQEARAAARLNHHNIVQVYDVGQATMPADKKTPAESTDLYYFSMEFVPHGNLHSLLSKQKKLDPLMAIRMVIDAAKGLQYAEREGIVHRDIKPDNLMIGEDNLIKIGDLGIALVKNTSQPSVNFVCGTPHYVAPEQALGKTVDSRADIYSLGATFYRMVTGVTPFSATTVKEILAKKTKEEASSPGKTNPELPSASVAIIEKMIKRKPDERYQNITELLSALEDLKSQLLVSSAVLEPTKETAKMRFPFMKAILPIILLLLSGLAIAFIIRHYYTDIKKNSPVVTPTTPSAMPGSSTHQEEKLAQQYFRAALQFERERMVPPGNIDAVLNNLLRTIKLYEKIIRECPHVSVVPEAREKINKLNSRVEELKTEQLRETREKTAQEKFNTLAKSFEDKRIQLINNLNSSAVPYFIEQTLDDLTQLKQEYTDTAIPNRVDDQLAEINQWYERYQHAAEEWTRLIPQIDNYVKEHQFETAREIITRFLNNANYRATLSDRLAQNRLVQVEKSAKDTFDLINAEATNLISDGKRTSLEQARQLLTAHRNHYGINTIENRIQKLLNQTDELINQYVQEEDATIFNPVFIQSLWLSQKGDFKSARDLLMTIKTELKTNQFQQKYQQIIDRLEWEEHIIKFLIDHINKGTLRQVRLRRNFIKAANKKGISTMIGNNPDNTVTFPWEEISALEIYDLVIRYPGLSAAECLGLGVLCLHRGGLVKQGQLMLSRTQNLIKKHTNSTDQSLLPIINSCLVQSRLMPDQRANEARLILDQAQTYLQSQEHKQALNTYLLLKYRYNNTKLYKGKSDFIRKQIGLCR